MQWQKKLDDLIWTQNLISEVLVSFSSEQTEILCKELCSKSCLWIKMVWVLQNWQTIMYYHHHHYKPYCSLAADICSIPICSYEYSYMLLAFDSYSREEIEDIFLIADSIFYKILNLVSAKQCRDLLLCRQCKVFINYFAYDHGTEQFLTSYANPNLVSTHWGYYLDLQWYTEKYGSF